jgi:hypothetical protein
MRRPLKLEMFRVEMIELVQNSRCARVEERKLSVADLMFGSVRRSWRLAVELMATIARFQSSQI